MVLHGIAWYCFWYSCSGSESESPMLLSRTGVIWKSGYWWCWVSSRSGWLLELLTELTRSIYQYKVCYQQEAEPRTRGKGIKSEPVRIKPQWGSRIFVLQIWYDRSDMVTMQWGRWTLKTSSSGDHLTLCGLLLQVSHLFSRTRQDQTSEKGCDRMFISNLLNSARS